MKLMAIVAVIFLASCENPMFNIGASVSSDGNVRVSPSVSGRVGDVGVAVSG
ncbi:MAG: hypothetical protein HKN27_04890 [Silicimonas sp.]|nr:hypothetical protein [Silicimonas sp.]